MPLTRWDPFKEMEEMFDRYARGMDWPGRPSQRMTAGGDWAPRVDIAETDAAFTIEAEIPEVKKEDVAISVDNGVLTVRGERKQEKEEKHKKCHRKERFYGSFVRSFNLPDNVDESGIEAVFKEGMLTVRIPKVAGSKSKVIDVKIK